MKHLKYSIILLSFLHGAPGFCKHYSLGHDACFGDSCAFNATPWHGFAFVIILLMFIYGKLGSKKTKDDLYKIMKKDEQEETSSK